MCRYVCDVRPMLKVLVGDALELPEKPLSYSTLNVYYVRSFFDPMVTPVDVEIKQGLDRVVKHFIDKGSRTLELDTKNEFSDLRHGFIMWNAVMDQDSTSSTYLDLLTEFERSSINPYFEMIKCMFGCNDKYTAAILLIGIGEELKLFNFNKKHYLDIHKQMKKKLHELLSMIEPKLA